MVRSNWNRLKVVSQMLERIAGELGKIDNQRVSELWCDTLSANDALKYVIEDEDAMNGFSMEDELKGIING